MGTSSRYGQFDGDKFNVSDIMTEYFKREDIDKILHIMGMQVRDTQCCIASMQYKSFGTGEGVDYWIRTQKEQWPGSDVDKPQVTEFWRETMKEHHDKLKNEVIANSSWLREHVRPRTTLFHPLYLPHGPSQARHVQRMNENQRTRGWKQQQVQCVRRRLAVLAQRGEYDSANVHRMDGVCATASWRSPVPLLVVRFSVGDFALLSLQPKGGGREGGVTENTVTFNVRRKDSSVDPISLLAEYTL